MCGVDRRSRYHRLLPRIVHNWMNNKIYLWPNFSQNLLVMVHQNVLSTNASTIFVWCRDAEGNEDWIHSSTDASYRPFINSRDQKQAENTMQWKTVKNKQNHTLNQLELDWYRSPVRGWKEPGILTTTNKRLLDEWNTSKRWFKKVTTCKSLPGVLSDVTQTIQKPNQK